MIPYQWWSSVRKGSLVLISKKKCTHFQQPINEYFRLRFWPLYQIEFFLLIKLWLKIEDIDFFMIFFRFLTEIIFHILGSIAHDS